MKLPRVALLSSSAGIQAGGAEAYTFATAAGLRRLGVPVTVIHGKGPACPCHQMGASHATGPVVSRASRLIALLRNSGIFRATRTSPYDLEVISRGLLSPHPWKLLGDFDLVEVQYATEALLLRYADRRALKILHLHGPSVASWLARLCRLCGAEPDVVVTCSEWSRSQLQARKIPWPIEVNYNGIDEQLFHPGQQLPAHELPGDSRRPFRIGFTGRLSAFKGLDTIARASALLGPGFEFHIVGPVEGGFALPSGVNLFYRGPMSSEAVADFLRTMDCFYFPSLRESFGIGVVEAMSTTLPVIASEVGGLPEVIRSGMDGMLVPVEDAGAGAQLIRQMRDNPTLRRSLGQAARRTVLARFTAAHTARRLLEIHARWSVRQGSNKPWADAAAASDHASGHVSAPLAEMAW
jgi:glycosyltransferase involved in cell wall biosynthesis